MTTPIKAAAEPSREALLALAQELRCARAETLGLNGKIRMPIELIIHCEAILSKLAAAPAGNAGVRKALEEIGRYARKIRKSENLIGPAEYMHDAKAMKVWQRALYHEGKTIEGMVKAALRGSELAEPTKDATALSATQPREAFADEIKRADAAPPEASFDNASDMLGYLNAPARGAGEIAITDAMAEAGARIAAKQRGHRNCDEEIITDAGKQPVWRFYVEEARAILALTLPQARETKSPPLVRASDNTGQRDPSVMPDSGGGDTQPREAEPGKPVSFMDAMNIVERGFDTWKDKPHNAKWYSRIDGTPIPNDLKVNIAEAICHSTLSASPSPIPEAPAGRDPATIEACANIAMLEFERHVKIVEAATNDRALSDSGRSLIQERADNAALAAQRIASQIRALKPQDGGESGR